MKYDIIETPWTWKEISNSSMEYRSSYSCLLHSLFSDIFNILRGQALIFRVVERIGPRNPAVLYTFKFSDKWMLITLVFPGFLNLSIYETKINKWGFEFEVFGCSLFLIHSWLESCIHNQFLHLT